MSYWNEDRRLLQESAKALLREKAPVNAFRALRDADQPMSWDPSLWREMVAMGWSGVLASEDAGGAGLAPADVAVLATECGRTLATSPLIATAGVGMAVANAMNPSVSGRIALGEITVGVAFQEGNHWDHGASTTITPQGNGGTVTGHKSCAIDAAQADALIVTGRTPSGEKAIAWISGAKSGVSRQRLLMTDHRDYAACTFESATADVVVTGPKAESICDMAESIGAVLMAAEMVGACDELFERTTTYLKERKQFGVLIGSFQALQHRAANLFCDIELARSAVQRAATDLGDINPQTLRLVSLAKGQAGATLHTMSLEAVQMHGGMGVTEELDMGMFLKRARMQDVLFGSTDQHRSRYAEFVGLNA